MLMIFLNMELFPIIKSVVRAGPSLLVLKPYLDLEWKDVVIRQCSVVKDIKKIQRNSWGCVYSDCLVWILWIWFQEFLYCVTICDNCKRHPINFLFCNLFHHSMPTDGKPGYNAWKSGFNAWKPGFVSLLCVVCNILRLRKHWLEECIPRFLIKKFVIVSGGARP